MVLEKIISSLTTTPYREELDDNIVNHIDEALSNVDQFTIKESSDSDFKIVIPANLEELSYSEDKNRLQAISKKLEFENVGGVVEDDCFELYINSVDPAHYVHNNIGYFDLPTDYEADLGVKDVLGIREYCRRRDFESPERARQYALGMIKQFVNLDTVNQVYKDNGIEIDPADPQLSQLERSLITELAVPIDTNGDRIELEEVDPTYDEDNPEETFNRVMRSYKEIRSTVDNHPVFGLDPFVCYTDPTPNQYIEFFDNMMSLVGYTVPEKAYRIDDSRIGDEPIYDVAMEISSCMTGAEKEVFDGILVDKNGFDLDEEKLSKRSNI